MRYYTSLLRTRVEFWTLGVLSGATIQILFLMCHWPLYLIIPYVTAIQWKKQCSIWTEFKAHFSCNFCVGPGTSQQTIPSFRDLTSTTFASNKPILSLNYKQASWQSPTSLDWPVTLSVQKNGKWVSLVAIKALAALQGCLYVFLSNAWFQSWAVLLGTPTHQYKCCLYYLGK